MRDSLGRCRDVRPQRTKGVGSIGPVTLCAWAIVNCLGAGAAELTARDLIQTRDIANPTVSPDGRYVAFLVEVRNVRVNAVRLTWYVENLRPKPGRLRVVANGGVPIRDFAGPLVPARGTWSPDSRWIYFIVRRKGQVQVWRAGRQGGEMQQVTHDAADVETFVLSSDGTRIYYTVGASRNAIEAEERREYERGVRLTPTLDVLEPVLYNWRNDDGTRSTERTGKSGGFELLDGEPLRVRVMTLGQAAHTATAKDRADYGKLEEASGIDELDALEHGWYDSKGARVLPAVRGSATVFWTRLSLQTIPLSERYQLMATKEGSRTRVLCKAQACREYIEHFSAPQWRPRSDEVIWESQTESGASTLYAWNAEHNTVRTILSSGTHLGGTAGLERYYLMGCPITAREAVCVTSAAASPPRLETINLQTGARSVIFDPNSDLRRQTFGEVRHLSWRDRWGQSHVGVLILPPGSRRGAELPLVITGYHCRGFLGSGSFGLVSPFILAESGIAVLCSDMDFRLVSKAYPGKSYGPGLQLPNLQVMLNSWESGVNALEEQGLVDDTRVGVSGLSFGSESVWYALTHSGVVSVAAVANPPIMDPFDYFMWGTAIGNQFAYRAMPDPTTDEAKSFYAMASVALNATKISAPVLLQTNAQSLLWGMETYTELNRFKRPYEVYIFPDEFHIWVQPQHILVIQKRTTDWFRFWLQGYEDPSPALRVQYSRWERLCLMQRREEGGHPTRCVILPHRKGL